MRDWDFSPPPPSSLGDHDVALEGTHLAGKRIALLLSGGIACIKAPMLARALRRQGAEVTAFASEEALRYVTEDALAWCTDRLIVKQLTAQAEHLSDRTPFDAYLVAPATYNTINKLRYGIADSVVTSVLASALGRMERGQAAVLVAPTMHGTMHTAILTESLRWLDAHGVRVIPPRRQHGKHNLPDEDVLVSEVCRAVSKSPLRGVPILVTGGPTPVPIDNVRRIVNRFTGRLGFEIAKELHLRGADAHFVLGGSSLQLPQWLPHTQVSTFDEYLAAVMNRLATYPTRCGIFSAAVADYRPETVAPGKIPSGGALRELKLISTPKVIEEVRRAHPNLHMVTFKYQEGMAHDALIEIARERVKRGDQLVVANRGEETGPNGEQVVHFVTSAAQTARVVGKAEIAVAMADHLERTLGHP
jgi:phosphopantothenoylcysteine decarboxylase/phosphopantothenate--cysteine ligase